MKVTIYTTTTCPYCKMLKDYLQQKAVEYREVIVDQDQAGFNEMMSLSGGQMGVPFTVISNDNGQKIKILGFDKNKLNEVLE